MTARPSKLYAGFQELQFLGHTVGKDMIKPEEKKISKILNFGRPTTKKQVRGVIGLLRRYVPDFSTLVCPLTELTKKGMPNKVVWTDRCQEALEKVQAVLSSDPVLKLSDLSKTFAVKTDASSTDTGGVLCQEFDGHLHPVLYASRRLLYRERRHSTIERECLAIVWVIDKFARYLWAREFALETDHRSVTYLRQSKLRSSRLMPWALAAQEFRVHIVPISGVSNLEADVLSRCDCDHEL